MAGLFSLIARYNAILFPVLCLLGCTPKESKQQELAHKLDDYFSKEFPLNEPGGAVLIAKGDSVVFSKGYGLADLDKKELISERTLFNLGSISKTFVANAILILQERGKLSVEDSLYKYFPNFRNKIIAKKVKIKHLLSHTSGLPDNRHVSADSVFYLTAKDAANWYPVTQTETLVFEPGEKFEYSNPAFNALALIVEQVSGMKWQQFISENIFKPSGMITSTITDGPYPEKGVSHGYARVHGRWREDDYGEEPTFAAAGNGGVWSSIEEMALYEQALRKAVFLQPAAIAQSWTVFNPPHWSDSVPPKRGWSWEINQTSDGFKTVEHHGDQGGFICNYVHLPDQQILFVILCNGRRDEPRFSRDVMNMLQNAHWLSE